jgi:hypothetical protein
MDWFRTRALHLLCMLFMRRAPKLTLDDRKEGLFRTFTGTALRAEGDVVSYTLPYPLHEFTRFLVREYPVLLHGTPNGELRELHPAEQTDHSGKRTTAVFATDDGIWPLYFATTHRSKYDGPISMRNAALAFGPHRRYYLFSLNREFHDADPFGSGMVLILPKEPFRQTDSRGARFPEWASPDPVAALARLAVKSGDFPFAGRIASHHRGEFFPLTWMLYRWRTR